MQTYNQTEDEAQLPLGIILDNNPSFFSKAKLKFSPRTKTYEYDGEELDPSQIWSDNKNLIPSNCCRRCERVITPYSEVYYSKHRDNTRTWASNPFSQKNCYCKECAISLSKEVTEADPLPRLISDEEREIYGDLIRVKTYSDGSTIEDMTPEEKARDPYLRGN